MAEQWRRIVASLADPVRRQVYAGVVLGVDVELPAKKRTKALSALVAAGLISADGDGFTVNSDAFGDLLAREPAVTRTGVDRFIRGGRIEQYPLKADDRVEVLSWARDQVLADDERLSEKEIGERLGLLTGDVALLRRYLVDYGLVERDASGREYWRSTRPQS